MEFDIDSLGLVVSCLMMFCIKVFSHLSVNRVDILARVDDTVHYSRIV